MASELPPPPGSAISDDLLEVLACPKCKGGLIRHELAFVCMTCALSYPVRSGIPVMLIDEAEPLAPSNGD